MLVLQVILCYVRLNLVMEFNPLFFLPLTSGSGFFCGCRVSCVSKKSTGLRSAREPAGDPDVRSRGSCSISDVSCVVIASNVCLTVVCKGMYVWCFYDLSDRGHEHEAGYQSIHLSLSLSCYRAVIWSVYMAGLPVRARFHSPSLKLLTFHTPNQEGNYHVIDIV